MDSYDERITSFAEGKQLQRLRQPVRNRGDGFCDACGSPQPNTLYGLHDKIGDRLYFVGSTCLQELSRKGVVVRPFGKRSASAAYDAEILRRKEYALVPDNISDAHREENPDFVSQDEAELEVYSPSVVVYETQGRYRAVVTLANSAAQVLSVGSAVEDCASVGDEGSMRESAELPRSTHWDRTLLFVAFSGLGNRP